MKKEFFLRQTIKTILTFSAISAVGIAQGGITCPSLNQINSISGAWNNTSCGCYSPSNTHTLKINGVTWTAYLTCCQPSHGEDNWQVTSIYKGQVICWYGSAPFNVGGCGGFTLTSQSSGYSPAITSKHNWVHDFSTHSMMVCDNNSGNVTRSDCQFN